jgi:energy-coupling factor transport system permease protein
MKSGSPLAYVPRRGVLQTAGLAPAALYLGAYLAICFLSSDPLVLIASATGAAIAGYGCLADRAVRFSIRLGLVLLVSMVVINGLVTSNGVTVLARLGEWPVFGRIDVTAESLVAGAVIGLRALGTMVVIGVWSACVDPDRMLHAASRVARRSALTATLISRLVPLAATDQARLSEAAKLRGPGAEPVGRVAMARRLLAGSLDRSVDVAATLELRGYGRAGGAPRDRGRRGRHDIRLWIAGGILAALGMASLASGAASFTTYPRIEWDPGLPVAVLCVALIAGGFATWRRRGRSDGFRG